MSCTLFFELTNPFSRADFIKTVYSMKLTLEFDNLDGFIYPILNVDGPDEVSRDRLSFKIDGIPLEKSDQKPLRSSPLIYGFFNIYWDGNCISSQPIFSIEKPSGLTCSPDFQTWVSNKSEFLFLSWNSLKQYEKAKYELAVKDNKGFFKKLLMKDSTDGVSGVLSYYDADLIMPDDKIYLSVRAYLTIMINDLYDQNKPNSYSISYSSLPASVEATK